MLGDRSRSPVEQASIARGQVGHRFTCCCSCSRPSPTYRLSTAHQSPINRSCTYGRFGCRQVKLIHKGRLAEKDTAQCMVAIRKNCVECMQGVLGAMKNFNIPLGRDESAGCMQVSCGHIGRAVSR